MQGRSWQFKMQLIETLLYHFARVHVEKINSLEEIGTV